MNPYHAIKFKTIIVSILMLISAQQAVFVHTAEHAFHQEEELCEAFIAVEKAKDALLPLRNILLVNKTASPFSYFTFAPISFLLVPQLARGPPSFS